MATNRNILLSALGSKNTNYAPNLQDIEAIQKISDLSLNSSNFGGGQARGIGLAAQLGTAAIGAYGQYKIKQKEEAAQQAFAEKYPQFADLASQLSPASREAFVLKDISKQTGLANENDPAAVREYNFYQNLSPEDQKNYINLKRTDPAVAAQAKEKAKFDYAAPIEEEKARGKNLGENKTLLASFESKIPELNSTVAELKDLAEKATYTATGKGVDLLLRQTGLPTREAAIARSGFISKIDNQVLPLLRDTFGAQFTENEGKALRATLGDPDLSPPEKVAALDSFITQKVRTIESLKRELGYDNKVIEKSRIIDKAPSLPQTTKSGYKFTIIE